MYPVFLGSWLVINFKCLFKRDTTWEKIEHVRDVKIDEVSDNKKKKNSENRKLKDKQTDEIK